VLVRVDQLPEELALLALVLRQQRRDPLRGTALVVLPLSVLAVARVRDRLDALLVVRVVDVGDVPTVFMVS
jgi:hypothetical protein